MIATGGHLDAPAFGYDTADGFEPHIHNEGGADGVIFNNGSNETIESEYEPDEVVIAVKSTVTTNLSGTDYYWLPEVQGDAAANGVVYLGVGLEELQAGDWVGGTVTITASIVSGPAGGEFRMWQDDGGGGAIDFINTDGGPSSFVQTAGSHTHYNWGFTELGTYEIEFGISGEHVVDGVIGNTSATYTFQVPEPSTALLGVLGGLLLLRRRRN